MGMPARRKIRGFVTRWEASKGNQGGEINQESATLPLEEAPNICGGAETEEKTEFLGNRGAGDEPKGASESKKHHSRGGAKKAKTKH